jgi:hypothetical protein
MEMDLRLLKIVHELLFASHDYKACNVRINVLLRRLRVTTVAVEKQ